MCTQVDNQWVSIPMIYIISYHMTSKSRKMSFVFFNHFSFKKKIPLFFFYFSFFNKSNVIMGFIELKKTCKKKQLFVGPRLSHWIQLLEVFTLLELVSSVKVFIGLFALDPTFGSFYLIRTGFFGESVFIRRFRLDPTFGSFTLIELVSLVKVFIRPFPLDPTFGSFTLLELVPLVKVFIRLFSLDPTFGSFSLLELVSLVKVCSLDSLDWIQLLEVLPY